MEKIDKVNKSFDEWINQHCPVQHDGLPREDGWREFEELVGRQESIPPEIAKVVDENFMDLIGDP